MTTKPLRLDIIASFSDIDGTLGKRLEFVEDVAPARLPPTEEARAIESIFNQVQVILSRENSAKANKVNPKILMFLTEAECDELSIDLEVNKTYMVEIKNGKIIFT
jgi:hypothetical protein